MIDPVRRGYVVAPILGEATSRSGAVDIAKRLWCVEGEFIRSNAQDGTVLLVQRQNVQVVMATENGDIRRDARYCPQLRTGEVAKRRPAERVDDAVGDPE
jgi:hypothetical protein